MVYFCSAVLRRYGRDDFNSGLANYDVAPDGAGFVMVALPSDSVPSIIVVQNWIQELLERAPIP